MLFLFFLMSFPFFFSVMFSVQWRGRFTTPQGSFSNYVPFLHFPACLPTQETSLLLASLWCCPSLPDRFGGAAWPLYILHLVIPSTSCRIDSKTSIIEEPWLASPQDPFIIYTLRRTLDGNCLLYEHPRLVITRITVRGKRFETRGRDDTLNYKVRWMLLWILFHAGINSWRAKETNTEEKEKCSV